MKSDKKALLFLSYILGLAALILVLTDDKEEEIYTFHIWQALLFNVFFGLLIGLINSVAPFLFFVDLRLFFILVFPLNIILIITFVVLVIVLGSKAYNGKKFKIPVIGGIVENIIK